MVYLLKMMIFYGYVSHNQRVMVKPQATFIHGVQECLPKGIACSADESVKRGIVSWANFRRWGKGWQRGPCERKMVHSGHLFMIIHSNIFKYGPFIMRTHISHIVFMDINGYQWILMDHLNICFMPLLYLNGLDAIFKWTKDLPSSIRLRIFPSCFSDYDIL